ncbi:MAG: hypothetical protein U0974_13075, partial [Gemmatimonadales bacterium]|nr:hypothetical protein [Gemmatimonadales bacterium]
EASGGGFDTISASVSYALGAGVSVERLQAVQWNATTAIDLTGNELSNILQGNAGANRMLGGGGNDLLYGLDGNDVLFGDAGDDLLVGGAGDDVLDGGAGDDLLDGGLGDDIVELRGLMSDYTITVIEGGYRVTDAIAGRDGSDRLFGVEILRFSDGSTTTLPLSVPNGSLVLPVPSDKSASEREVMPLMLDNTAKEAVPQTFRGEVDFVPTLVVDQRAATDFTPRDGDMAETLSMFGDLPDDEGHLFLAVTDAALPEVMPVLDDPFVLTTKFAGAPPVVPTLTGDIDDVVAVTEMDFARDLLLSLARDNPLHSNVSNDGLTLIDEWSSTHSSIKHDAGW